MKRIGSCVSLRASAKQSMWLTGIISLALSLFACTDTGQFASYEREFIGRVPIGESVTKQIVLRNPSLDKVQHISGLNFDAGANEGGNFRIDKVEIGGVAITPKDKDITVPVGSIVQIYVTYQPLNLDTTVAGYGGWVTGGEERYTPQKPKDAPSATDTMTTMIANNNDNKEIAIHRAMVVAAYDQPNVGLMQVEVVGEAEVGSNGERTAGGSSSGECPSEAGILCYKGGFALELPGIMTQGAAQLKLTGPIVLQASGSNVSIDMSTFPSALLVLKGNGPGEPLEGKPINAVSIIVSGAEGVTAKGTFDGTKLEVNGVAFRIRVALGEITEADITPGLQSAVDFNVKDVSLKTIKPYTNGSITLKVDTTLSQQPSGNAMFDQFLGGAEVIVTMDGNLTMQ